jgi:hypothetical protein
MNFRVAFLLLSTAIMPAFAQSGPSESEQREACMGDAMRLCSAYIPDRAQIRNCMAGQRDQLSPQCRAVFEASAQAQRSQPVRNH